ncbi:MAG: glucose-1-phosphate cytidylyltransferase [Thermodesulfobacteriota bacterium]|jgi:glucose-1-phosphate cytidylyltransferase|nr:glucose-1-phosphate cytidylyltransferase [Thermodesulfobacteriota bacterium]
MNNNIPVVILCGGFGTRLREETEFMPKPMVAIGNRPILWHIMKIYSHHGFRKFIICLGYKGEIIKKYFFHYKMMNNDFTVTLGSEKGIEIHNGNNEDSWEITLCNTGINSLKGARIKRVEKYINTDQFMVTYGDGVADVNIRELFDYHLSHGKTATVTGVRPKFLKFGELNIQEGKVAQFTEKPKYAGNYVNGGFFVFNRTIFNYLEDRDDCELEAAPLVQISQQDELMVYKHDNFWACMDTIRDREYLNQLWANNCAEWKIW